ncbi:hypothetical protein MP228_004259 [Amoeboaphelidium protococcarum]|nr:hypothetical protein MP228_004259 [Amoeboaphelidium protococcarum]
MIYSSNLGFPRVGQNRELKKMVENYWASKIDEKALLSGAKSLREKHWKLQKDLGVDFVPSNDFSFYDQVLDSILLFGATPQRYQTMQVDQSASAETVELTKYFAMARGLQSAQDAAIKVDLPAMEMKKWFDTNYHYIVPEFYKGQSFALSANPKPVREFEEAKALGVKTRPVLIGPITLLRLGKVSSEDLSFDRLSLLDSLLVEYEKLLQKLNQLGAEWIQLDEPILSLDLDLAVYKPLYDRAYARLKKAAGSTRLLVANYFGELVENLKIVTALPIDGLHVDLVRAPQELDAVLAALPKNFTLSAGVIDGRNIWKNNLGATLELLNKIKSSLQTVDSNGNETAPVRLIVSPSCSLLHTPYSLEAETKMDKQILDWLSFSVEKLRELVVLTKALNNGPDSVKAELAANEKSVQARKTSSLIHDQNVQAEMGRVSPQMMHRQSPFAVRYERQRQLLNLPLFPTTTIGSFPQTPEIRKTRLAFKKGEITAEAYEQFLQKETIECIRRQEEVGLDVLVHGEFERTDMVEYFGMQMKGYVFSENGWVQSYGSRCVKPPIIYGDVSRPTAMSVKESVFAQQNTTKIMKGMLTGPVTMLQWSFVRDDQPRKLTSFQLALALRKEVVDLEKAGISVIQIDEPAIREGLTLRKSGWGEYLKWAVDSFLLSSTGVKDETQIHSHFCYSDFNDIFQSIKDLDADVITIENARSDLKLLRAFKEYKYTNAIGPGLYDIHSPRVPSSEEMKEKIQLCIDGGYLAAEGVWINPDCGLKTRRWQEVMPSLVNMVNATKALRQQYGN